MIEHVDVVAHGRPATLALARAVVAAQAGDPLAPVTVVVPSNLAGLAARRLLGSGDLAAEGGPAGLANVGFVTPFRLAELLGADLVADRPALTNAVLGAAVRRVLHDDPGPFRQVADHAATEAALAALYGELSHVSPEALAAVEASGTRGAEAARIVRAVRAHLTGHHGEDELVTAAATRADLVDAVSGLGVVVWHLPELVTPAVAAFLAAVLAAAPSRVVVALCGDPAADAPVRAACAAVGVPWSGAVDEPTMPSASAIVSVTDPDEEVRAVVRQVAALVEQGVRLDRIGVFHPAPEPYVRILEQQLADAGIPANGPSRERLADSVAGRTLLAALDLPAQRWRRDRVLALVTGAPVRAHGRGARPPAWERLSRRAGVLEGLDDWRSKLDALADAEHQQLADLDASGAVEDPDAVERRRLWVERALADIAALRGFVDDLADVVGAVDRAVGWRAKAHAATALLHHLLGAGVHPGWPETEQAAFERVEEALSRLGVLDDLEPDPSTTVFHRALQAELDVTRGRSGRFGCGLVYGPLASAVGADLDAVFVVGMVEGLCPAPRRDDALLPDEVRAVTGGELAPRADRLHEQHRWLLAALAAAPADRRWLVHARGDLRSSRRTLPSRWLLASASALAGTTVRTSTYATVGPEVVRHEPSFAGALRAAAVHGSVLERDLAAVDAWGGDVLAHPAMDRPAVRRGLTCLRARASGEFTVWDGNLGGFDVPSPADATLLSATRLENWATCGFRYFLRSVLDVVPVDDPERIIELSPMERGSAVHEALEEFLGEVIARGAPAPGEPWTDADRARMRQIGAEALAKAERQGRTGRPLLWARQRARLLELFDAVLDEDEVFRADLGVTPMRVELPFGMDDAPPLELDLGGGRLVRFRGKADRVDEGRDGLVVVSDYKTGKGTQYRDLDQGDPVKAGTLLQLGLYAEAALRLPAARRAETAYWLVESQRHLGYAWTDDRRARFLEVLGAMVEGIEDGVFPMVPGEWTSFFLTHDNCKYCDYQALCPRDRGEQAEAKAGDPALAVRARLAWEPEEEAG